MEELTLITKIAGQLQGTALWGLIAYFVYKLLMAPVVCGSIYFLVRGAIKVFIWSCKNSENNTSSEE